MSLSKKVTKAKEPAIKKSIVQWCKDQTEQGNELKLVWEGGGDSGWVHFQIDGEDVSNNYTECLIDKMQDTLDYGSWAGEFSANGAAIYNPETNSFEGTDYYGEDTDDAIDVNYVIRVPKALWFESLNIETEANYDETPSMSVRFIVKNGFLTKEHQDFCSNLEEILSKDLEAAFTNYHSTEGCEFRSCYDNWILERSEGEEDEDDLVFNIDTIQINVLNNEEKSVVLELTEELVESIDDNLNDVENED